MTEETNDEQDQPRVTTPPRPFDDEAPDAGVAAMELGEVLEADAPEDETTDVLTDADEPVDPEPFEDLAELPSLLEALLFVADHPVDVGYLSRAIEVSVTRVEGSLDALAESLRESKRGIRLQRGPSGVQLVSAPEAAAQVERFLGLEANRRLSTAALETLAIIAYRQPLTRGQVDAVRGVSSDGAIATLRARELIEPAGHAPGPGRPMLFRTTHRFLEHFGLERPGQLPPLPEDIELPPSEIGAQLGLDDATVEAALRPIEPEPAGEDVDLAEAESDAEDTADPSSDLDDMIDEVVASSGAIEIPSDPQVLSAMAEHAFEASRERGLDPAVDEADEDTPTAES